MERIITMSPAFDKRSYDPEKDYGIHGVTLRMVLKGDRGATQFLLYTGWHLPHVSKELDAKMDLTSSYRYYRPMPADLGYHSPKPMYDGQTKMDCDILGGECYYDGSTLNAERIYDVLLKEGSDRVWRELENYYNELFGE